MQARELFLYYAPRGKIVHLLYPKWRSDESSYPRGFWKPSFIYNIYV